MRKSIMTLGLALALVFACIPADAAQQAASGAKNPVDQFTGHVWQQTPDKEKMSFLFGVETAIAVEYFVHDKLAEKAAKEGKAPAHTLSPFEKGWMKAFEGMSRADAVKMVDAWYAANPQRLDRPVMEVIWYELVAPRISAK
ncbi:MULTISPECIES: hypothetical protein [unclassified Desulfovibrio]|uniref:hypothetical protein n=1 Tax=unclassified Desulfovibrio TaxID=2593640 RepID=UPI000F5DA012|nr:MULTISPECIES: hypothetical protein [unclassified Desulfovibrio]RRD72396.1 hypothetical protein EII24_00585 [Desulfovibrio sp. OH1209_COT-279]RRD88507.1 hypothetical protein EII23_00585 [Desulfovibrio sp. OH1186_COT-070]